MRYKKNEIELSLVDDYINIILINNFHQNVFESEHLSLKNRQTFMKNKILNSKLKDKYEQLFRILKLDNLSLMILKKELKNNNSLFLKAKSNNFSNLEILQSQITLKLLHLEKSLKSKMFYLKISI